MNDDIIYLLSKFVADYFCTYHIFCLILLILLLILLILIFVILILVFVSNKITSSIIHMSISSMYIISTDVSFLKYHI
jgi:hypothetical protein